MGMAERGPYRAGEVVCWSWYPKGREYRYTGQVVAQVPAGLTTREAVARWRKKAKFVDCASQARAQGVRQLKQAGYLVLVIPRNGSIAKLYAPDPRLLYQKEPKTLTMTDIL